MTIQILSTFLHIPSIYYFVWYQDFGVQGCGYATIITNVFLLFGNIIQTKRIKEFKNEKKVGILDKRVWTEFRDYTGIGVPNMLMMVMEWACFEILNLFSGQIGVTELAVQIVLANIGIIFSGMAYGMMEAVCALVGEQIGANNI
jgi:Na+-driven multidrug efflux pump